MEKNLEIWNRLKTPPGDALKQILAGRLKGKSDINPQWRYEAMTGVFGMVGVGWKYEIVKLWTESGSEGQVFAFAQVAVSIAKGEGWSAPVPGVGGSMLIDHEIKGLYSNDEAFKMAITDALGVAMKFFGVASDIYRGHHESKYMRPSTEPASVPVAPNPVPVPVAKPETAPAEKKIPVDAPPKPADSSADPVLLAVNDKISKKTNKPYWSFKIKDRQRDAYSFDESVAKTARELIGQPIEGEFDGDKLLSVVPGLPF